MTPEAPQEPTAPAPLRDRDFRWFFAGRFVSLLGSSMAPVALAFAVLKASHRAGDLGIVLAARSVPLLLFLLVGGVVADRFSRRTVLVVSNLGAAVTQGCAAAILISGHYHLAAIAVLEFLNGVLAAFTTPALRGIVPELLEESQRQRANSLLGSAKNATSVFGPSVAGAVVVTVGSGWALAADAASYLAAAVCLAGLALTGRVTGGRQGFLRELREGWDGFRALTWVCTIVLAFAVTNCIYVGVWNVLGPTVALASVGAASWGTVLSVRAAGVLAASAAMYRLPAMRSLAWGLLLFALGAVPMVVLGLGGGLWLLAPAALLAGIGQGVMAIVWETSLQNRVRPTLLSRIAAYDDLVSFVAVPVGQVGVAPFAAAFGQTRVMVVGGVLFGAVAALPVLFRSVRRPDAGTGVDARMAVSRA